LSERHLPGRDRVDRSDAQTVADADRGVTVASPGEPVGGDPTRSDRDRMAATGARVLVETVSGDRERTVAANAEWTTEPGAPPHDVGPAAAARRLPVVPGFTVLSELGRGGMGVVYLARRAVLNRPCALKMILSGDHASPEESVRFLAEAEAAGRIRHPNALQIYSVGDHDGRPYLELEFADGGSLADRLDGAPWPGRRAAAMVEPLARAVGEAHRLGIIHRDIKPGNVLLTADGTPKVADFGLARSIAEGSGLTATDSILGSPSYMAPEQAAGRTREAGPPADVYSLGAILYELLTGRPPFRGASMLDTLEQVKTAEPVPPGRLVPATPRDLETIALKCLQKDPARRYPSAAELADDVGRFLRGEPIAARPVGAAERAWRWCRRHPDVAGLSAACALAVVVGFALVVWQWRTAEGHRARAVLAEGQMARERDAAVTARRDADAARDDSLRLSAGLTLDKALALADRGDQGAAVHWMVEALRVSPAGEADAASRRLIRRDLAAWSGRIHAPRLILAHDDHVTGVAFSPDGRTLATGSRDGTARLWDAATGTLRLPPIRSIGPKISAVAFGPDGRTLHVVGGEGPGAGFYQRFDAETGRPSGPAERFESGPEVNAMVWNCRCSPDGRTLWIQAARFGYLPRDAATGAPRPLLAGLGRVLAAPFPLPDGRTLVLCEPPGQGPGPLAFRDVATGRPVGELRVAPGEGGEFGLSPDGRVAFILTDRDEGGRTVQMRELATGRPIGPPLRSPARSDMLASRPDGRVVAFGGQDGSVRFWDARTGRDLGAPLRHQGRIRAIAFGPDGRTLLTASEDATARVWDLGEFGPAGWGDELAVAAPAVGHSTNTRTVAVDARGARVLLADHGAGLARLIDAATGRPIGPPLRHPRNEIGAAAFSPDGSIAATACADKDSLATSLHLWDTASGRPIGPPLPHPNHVRLRALAFSPDGRTLAAGDYTGGVTLWDVAAGRPLRRLLQEEIVISVAFSPDGRTLAAGTADGRRHGPQARLWDVATGRPVGRPMGHTAWVEWVGFRPDGKALLTKSGYSDRLWDAGSGEPMGEAQAALSARFVAAFAPDGRSFLCLDDTRTLRLRDAGTARAVGPAIANPARVTTAAFSPDSTTAVIGLEDGRVRLWDLATARPIGPPEVHRATIIAVAFAADGRASLSVSEDGDVRRRPVPEPDDGAVDRLALRARVRTGLLIDAGRGVTPMAIADWREDRRRLDEADGTPATLAFDPDWHDQVAREAEIDGDAFGALWHLDRLLAARPGDGALLLRRARVLAFDARPGEAGAALEAAGRVLPAGRVGDWLRYLAADARAQERWATAGWALDRLVASGSRDWWALADRAEVLDRLGRGAERAADVARAIELGADPVYIARQVEREARAGRWAESARLAAAAAGRRDLDPRARSSLALVSLRAGDSATYRRVCAAAARALSERPTATMGEVNSLAWTLALGPGGLDRYDEPIAQFEAGMRRIRATEGRSRHTLLNTLGGLLCRAGRWDQAASRLAEGLAADPGGDAPQDWALLALAHAARGDRAEARRWAGRLGPRAPSNSPSAFWDELEIALLRREAEAAVDFAGPLPEDVFAQ
jgi:WD40 repeat protein/tetratricopeptide (TPR) repeat protein